MSYENMLMRSLALVERLQLESAQIFHDSGEHSGDHNQGVPKSTAIHMGGVLRYKWEAYCDTNGRSTEVFLFPESSGAPKALQCKLEAYCNTNWRRIAVLFWAVVVVGVSDILLRQIPCHFQHTICSSKHHNFVSFSHPESQSLQPWLFGRKRESHKRAMGFLLRNS